MLTFVDDRSGSNVAELPLSRAIETFNESQNRESVSKATRARDLVNEFNVLRGWYVEAILVSSVGLEV